MTKKHLAEVTIPRKAMDAVPLSAIVAYVLERMMREGLGVEAGQVMVILAGKLDKR